MIVRAVDEATSDNVIIKMLRDDSPGHSYGNRLRREFSVAQHISSDRIIRVVTLKEHRNAPFLVKMDVGGSSLDRVLSDSPLDLATTLRVGISIAESLMDIHDAGVMHKDVKPANIIVDDELSKAWLTDFDISSQLRREKATESNLIDLAGSLPYISPEQTGRMNRSVDTRTDLYSLGVTLYEMATGRRPFAAADAMELVHCHIARQPADASSVNSAIPEPLNTIIMRLLAKTAEDRYQSATGVRADLARCLESFVSTGRIEPFPLGTQDVPLQLRIPEKLYGRTQETTALLDLYERVSAGSMEVATVSGYSGIGKSSLVNELNKPITRNRGRFHVGKFDQYKRSVPYSALTQALDSVGKRLLTEDEESSTSWRSRIMETVGASAGVLTDLVPSFATLLGVQPALIEMGGVDAQNRQNKVLVEAIKATAQAEHPLVIFIDDVQWADAWTLSFLDVVAQNPIPYLFLILAYRDNEAPEGHPFHATLAQFERNGRGVTAFHLRPLTLTDVRQLINDTFPRTATATTSLADLIHQKTDGNPFFVAQFLSQLHDDGLLTIDAATGIWSWEESRISKHAMTENVVDLLTQKLRTLNDEQQHAIAVAAIIGSQFPLPVLAAVLGSGRSTATALWRSIVDGSIRTEGVQSLDDVLHDPDNENVSLQGITGWFAHDKIRQAAFELLSDDERILVHRNIADAYLKVFGQEEMDEQVFDLAEHLIASIALRRDREEQDREAAFLMRAGDKAMATSAFSAARKYYESAITHVGVDLWQRDQASAIALQLKLGDALWSNNDQADLERLLDDLESRDLSTMDRVHVLNMRRRISFAHLRLAETIDWGRRAMSLLGVNFPKKATKLHAARELLRLNLMTRKMSPQDLANLPTSTDATALMIIEIIAEISEAVYYNDPDLFPLILLKQMELTLKYGNHANSASVFVGYGIIRTIALNDVNRAYDICQMALSLPDRFNVRQWRPKNELSYAYLVQQRKEHIDETYKHFQLAYRLGLETAMHSDVANATIGLSYHALFQGREVSQLQRESETYMTTLRMIKQMRNVYTQMLYQTAFIALQDPDMVPTFDRGEFSEELYLKLSHETGDLTSVASFGMVASYVFLIFQKFDEARRVLDDSKPYARYVHGLHLEIWHPFVDGVLIARTVDMNNVRQRRKAIREIRRLIKPIANWARLSPANYGHMVHILQAEVLRLQGQVEQSKVMFQQAIDEAAAAGFVNCEAIASDCAIQLYVEQGDVAGAMRMRANALDCYRRWGVVGRVRELERSFPELTGTTVRTSEATATTATTLSASTSHDGLDLGTVMKASHVIAAEIDRNKLVETTLKIMMENAGADHGVLLMKQDGLWRSEAMHSFNSDLRRSTSDVPMSVISYVERAKDSVVLSDAVIDGQFGGDPYIAQHKPPSILCLPILHQSKLVGILYLENTLTKGAFTTDRIAVLNLLTVQSAISLENAALYQNLELKVVERTKELQHTNELLATERERTERLLLNVLPVSIVDRLKRGETTIADRSAEVSVLFADIANFTHYASERSPEEVVTFLNGVFNTFDDLVTKYGLEKIKTIGDAYLVVSGIPEHRADHAEAIALLASEMQEAVPRIKDEYHIDHLGIRIGIHTGPVVAGVIGRSKFSYDLWGDTVNLAARMESHGRVGSIHVSDEFVKALLSQSTRPWSIEDRGHVDVKGKGHVKTFWLKAE